MIELLPFLISCWGGHLLETLTMGCFHKFNFVGMKKKLPSFHGGRHLLEDNTSNMFPSYTKFEIKILTYVVRLCKYMEGPRL